MAYWLMKSEPDVFSIQDLKRVKKSGWDGVRNYQARNFMRDGMKKGDLVLFYHSNAEPSGIAGVARVASSSAYPDPLQFDEKSDYFDKKATKEKPIWMQVDVEFVEAFPRVLSLAELKTVKALTKMPLLQKGTRLSVMPVAESEWNAILSLAK
jgi:predicted RNA-binding protein with PUA-like domain